MNENRGGVIYDLWASFANSEIPNLQFILDHELRE